ncbi:patatin-like phospholipase family protein [Archangium violaceum]|uniref:patatin-like phospholipase family protein n=1 Tax=Archangium violaceum TaxID=83451 RepID=UPI00194E13F7|nr:patatin-like phospholipase family protein [Archangium violaceum]QRN97462.1 patatin-like phospholipase family protein [Archangium violaceum]
MTPEERKKQQERDERQQKKREWKDWMVTVEQARQDVARLKLDVKRKPSPLDFKKHFLGHAGVNEKLRQLRAECEGKRFSDIVDDEGHPYVDLVMEGGGTLGIALLGYIHALESMGIRFLSIGGTSAGSITALLLAAAKQDKRQAKAEELFHMLSELDLPTILDSRFPVSRFIRAVQRRVPKPKQDAGWGARVKGRLRSLAVGVSRFQWGVLSCPSILRRLGLNPGERFLERVHKILEAHQVPTAGDLNKRMTALPDRLLEKKDGQAPKPIEIPKDKRPRLALVASEVSTGTKVVFPQMARLFWKDAEKVDPSLFVRASMSVPFFFRPLRPEDMPRNDDEWNELVDYDGGTPVDSCTLVDGGIMSNFPISEFHSTAIPRTPTFGVKLGLEKRKRIDAMSRGLSARPLGQLGAAIFNSARQTLDEDFINKNPDYKKLITTIDTGPHDWLKFDLSADEQVDLFLRGVAAGAIFLKHFDWPKYQEVRKQLERAQLVGAEEQEPPRPAPGAANLTPPTAPPA